MSNQRPILVMSNVILDDVQYPDGALHPRTLGGAAVYAAAAASMWWGQIGIVAGVGSDFDETAGAALARYGIRRDGLIVRDANTIKSKLVYHADGERSETPVYGGDHFARLQLTPADIPEVLLPAAGTYIFRDTWPDFWSAFQSSRKYLGTVMWELQGDAAQARNLSFIAALFRQVDLFSLNIAEAHRILGSSAPESIVTQLVGAGAPVVVLRMGADGALVSNGPAQLHVKPPPSPVVDVTGGGNAFCGGFLAGWCQRPGDLEHASRCGAASAALTLAQHGLPSSIIRRDLLRLYDTTGISQHSLSFDRTSYL
jgi:sugar/nucleoside kinase (ribokinase family)